MFLFLSKLLPLFIYPLGMTCLLMLWALALMWKHPRLAAIPILLGLVILLVAGNSWISNRLIQSLEFQNIPSGELPQAEAIVVLGGATEPAFPPRPWVELREEGDRVAYAAKLYRDGKAPRVILSGGRIQWHGKFPPESGDMAVLMEAMGVPATAILQDPTSLNTRENAVNVKQIMETAAIRRILLVTSAMHMPRSLMIFKKLGIDAIPAPTDFITVNENNPLIEETAQTRILDAIPDADTLFKTTKALKEYIGIWIYSLRGWV